MEVNADQTQQTDQDTPGPGETPGVSETPAASETPGPSEGSDPSETQDLKEIRGVSESTGISDAPEPSQNTGPFKRNADLDRLIRLQKLDREIARKTRLMDKTLPAEIETLKADYLAAKEALETYDEEIKALSKQRKDLEAEVEGFKEGISKAKQKLPDLKTNVEYRAAIKEAENFEKKIIAADDKQLDLMEQAETKAAGRKELEDKAAVEKKKFDGQKSEKEEGIAHLKKKVDELNAERAGTVGDITANILNTYDKVSKQRGGVGVVNVIDRSCHGCHQMIPPQLYYLIRTTEEIYKCPHCDRYLYHEPDEADAEAESE